MLFFSTLILGTLIAISSYSWMSMWMGLEINLLSIIPLLSDSKNLYPSESSIKYFITQALASSILLFSLVLSLNLNEFIPQPPLLFSMILNSALLTKMGAAPFHSWFPEVMEGLSWTMGLIMLTWQKLAPMTLLFYNLNLTYFLSVIIIFSTVISGILGLNQISLRKIMAYSSINHIGWMLASMMNMQMIWLFYFSIYCLISLNIILILKMYDIYYLSQLFLALSFNKSLKFLFILNFLSLGGLPPFLGFFPKWLVINNLVSNGIYFMSALLIIFTLITLFFYLRITFSTLVINTNESLLYSNLTLSFWVIFLNFLALSGLLACSLVFNYF